MRHLYLKYTHERLFYKNNNSTVYFFSNKPYKLVWILIYRTPRKYFSRDRSSRFIFFFNSYTTIFWNFFAISIILIFIYIQCILYTYSGPLSGLKVPGSPPRFCRFSRNWKWSATKLVEDFKFIILIIVFRNVLATSYSQWVFNLIVRIC